MKCLYFPSVWTRLHSHGSSHSTITRSTFGTSNFPSAMGRSGTRMDQAGARRDAPPVHAPLIRKACKEFGHSV
jgi:hypothetical protein